jgi:hypothetical protein
MLDRQLHDSLVTKEVKQKVLLQAAELLDQQFLGNLLRIDTLDSIYCALENLVQKLKQEGEIPECFGRIGALIDKNNKNQVNITYITPNFKDEEAAREKMWEEFVERHESIEEEFCEHCGHAL